MILWMGQALAAPHTLASQLEKGATIIEAKAIDVRFSTVVSDGETLAITHHDIDITTVHTGSLPLGPGPSVLLPGGWLGEGWVMFAGTPPITLGEHYLLVGKLDEKGIFRLSSLDNSVFWRIPGPSGDIVADPWGHPIAEQRCDGLPQRVWPLSKAPSSQGDEPAPSEALVSASAGRRFAADPTTLGMSWERFVDTTRACAVAP